MSKHSIQINNELYSDILEFCKANNEKISVFCERILKDGLLREKYGDTPFAIYETTIINNNPVSALTRTVTIEKPYKDEPIELPFKIEPVTETIITGGRDNISEKYVKKVPKEYYSEIKVEEPKKTKTRRL